MSNAPYWGIAIARVYMNVLIINGSPKKRGLIAQMLGILQNDAEMAGDEVTNVYANSLSINPS